MLELLVRGQRTVFLGCPSGHPGGSVTLLPLLALVASELFTKHPPDPQPPFRVNAVAFRVLAEQLIPEL